MDTEAEKGRIFLLLLELISRCIFSRDGSAFLEDMDEYSIKLLCQEVENNRLGVLLYYYCGRDNILPGPWSDKWSADFRAGSAEELRRAGELKNIYKILSDNDIDAAPLKGACLAYNYYPHPALRNMCDFDILVKADKIKKAFQLMLDNNFTADYDFGNRCHEAQLTSPRGFILELHSHIDSDVKRCDSDYLWKESRKLEFSEHSITHLSPEINLLHAIHHAFKDNLVGGLKAFIDVAYILNRADITSKQLVHCAEKIGFNNELSLFMNIFPDFFPAEYIPDSNQIPPGLLEKVRYLIYSFKYIQGVDRHQLLLHREYSALNLTEKFLFLMKKMYSKPASVAKIYNCRLHSPKLVFYYLYRVKDYFMKFVTFSKKSKWNNLNQKIGLYQKYVKNYLNDNTK